MSSRSEARRRGLKVAAQVAAVAGLIGACAGMGRADTSKTLVAPQDHASVENLLSAKGMAGNCGCAPCWGPPAPPVMRAKRASAIPTEVAA